MTRRRHEFYMEAALAEARQSYAKGEFPVGCVIVCRDTILATGRRTNSGEGGNEIDHAEMRAVRTFLEIKPPVILPEVIAYSTMEPCLMCFSTLILSGIRTIVYAYEDVMGGGSSIDLTKLAPLYAQMDVSIIDGILRKKSLALFKDFFSNQENLYLQGSLLARYTLQQ